MLDMDGFVADFCLGFSTLASQLFPKKNIIPFGCGAAQVWGFTTGAGVESGLLTKEENRVVWDHIYKSDLFWINLPPLFNQADREALWRLHSQHELCWVTSRSGKNVADQTSGFIAMHNLPNYTNVTIAGSDKGEFVKANPHYDVAIDDGPNQIERMSAVGQKVVIMDQPYNRHLIGYHRVTSISEFEVWLNWWQEILDGCTDANLNLWRS